MKSLSFLVAVCAFLAVSCARESNDTSPAAITPDKIAIFRSTDKKLEKAYEWARKTALSYTYNGTDPVGNWYAAGLPKREAFCIRDVSHQAVGAQILGLAGHNKNMLSRIAAGISDDRDWCSFWEINRYGKPVPADYSNDKEFWYNLTANFDMIQACLKMYDWTGDMDYVADSSFVNFFDRTVNDYVARWNLTPELIMSRPPYMNTSPDFDPDNKFHVSRGIPSYNENLPGLTVGVDLVAALYGGHEAYARILMQQNTPAGCDDARIKAQKYRDLLECEWWNPQKGRYYSALMQDGSMVHDEGSVYILWFDASANEERMRSIFSNIVSSKWDIQYSSYFPEVFYRHGYCSEAYDYLMGLPTLSVADYPEIAFSFISGCVCGAMGVTPSYCDKCIETLCRLGGDDTQAGIDNIALYDGYISVSHTGHTESEISNDTSVDLTWKASFLGDYDWIVVDNKRYPTVKNVDLNRNTISTVSLPLASNTTLRACAV